MADYFSPTVVQPTIPNADMMALERLLLTHIFESEPDGDGLYFFAETAPNDQIELPIAELRAALASAEGVASETAIFVQDRLKDVGDDEPYVQIDLSGTSYEFILQGIVERSSTLNHIAIVTSFTCTKCVPMDLAEWPCSSPPVRSGARARRTLLAIFRAKPSMVCARRRRALAFMPCCVFTKSRFAK
jgi:hypothetical protein